MPIAKCKEYSGSFMSWGFFEKINEQTFEKKFIVSFRKTFEFSVNSNIKLLSKLQKKMFQKMSCIRTKRILERCPILRNFDKFKKVQKKVFNICLTLDFFCHFSVYHQVKNLLVIGCEIFPRNANPFYVKTNKERWKNFRFNESWNSRHFQVTICNSLKLLTIMQGLFEFLILHIWQIQIAFCSKGK